MEFYDSVSKFLHPKIVNLEIFRQMRTVCLVCTQIICHFEKYQNLIEETQNELIGEYGYMKDVEIKDEHEGEITFAEKNLEAEEENEVENIKSEEEFMELSQTSNANVSDVVTGANISQHILNEDPEETYDSETQNQNDIVADVNMSQNSLDFSAKENCLPSHRKTSVTSTCVQGISEEETDEGSSSTNILECSAIVPPLTTMSPTSISPREITDHRESSSYEVDITSRELNATSSHNIDGIEPLTGGDFHMDTSTLLTPSTGLESRDELPIATENSSPNKLDAPTTNNHTNSESETQQSSNPAHDLDLNVISPNPEDNSPIDSLFQIDPENLLIPIASPEMETNSEKNHENVLKRKNYQALARPLKCRFCSNTYSYKSSLSNHIRRHHRNSQKFSHPCKHCQRKFFTRRGLNVHCSQLHRGFKAPKRITQSDGTTVYACQQCDQIFISYKLFYSHRWYVHILQPNYKCKLCGEHFNNSHRLLQEHIIETHGYIKCLLCNKMFANRKTLTDHQRIKHSAEYAEIKAKQAASKAAKGFYKCPTCPTSFINLSNFELHCRIAHSKPM
ncbi:uncharacterized protein [Musca autumnalis]|uniref:uncharacterized protein n=1 Tax=Musca autumnalis TaxID=221902 RepID=UPI003CF0814A